MSTKCDNLEEKLLEDSTSSVGGSAQTFFDSKARICMILDAKKELIALEQRNDQNSMQSYRSLERYFDRFINEQPLHHKMFKPQRRIEALNETHMVYEFKAYQFRIYGVIEHIGEKKTFVGVECDPAKKQDKADPAILKKTVETWVGYKNDCSKK